LFSSSCLFHLLILSNTFFLGRFGRPGPSSAFAQYHTFRELLKQFMPKTFAALKTIGALDDKYLSTMFVDFFAELLPTSLLLSLMDAYLLEGEKILFRFGLALIHGYKSAIKNGEFSTAKEFWLAIKSDSFAVNSFQSAPSLTKVLALDEVLPTVDQFIIFEHAKNQDYLNSKELFLAVAYDEERSVFQKSYRSMKVSRAHIVSLTKSAKLLEPPTLKATYAHRQSSVNNRSSSITGGGGTSPAAAVGGQGGALARKQSMTGSNRNSPTPSNNTSNSNIPIPTTTTTNNTTANNNTNNVTPNHVSPGSPTRIKSIMSPPSTMPLFLAVDSDAQVIPPSTLIASHSSILDVSSADKLLSCLPKPFNSFQYELRFATYRHGWDISSLYARIERYESCIFLFHLLAPYDHVVIGAFNRGPLSPPNQNLTRGDGMTSRIFKLVDNEPPVSFSWVHLNKPHRDMDDESEEPPVSGTISQFAVSTTSSLSFGASKEHTTNALRLDSDLKVLHTGPSDTYGNDGPLLVPLNGNSGEGKLAVAVGDLLSPGFQIKEIEIFCVAANRHVMKE
jgi:hypothetical protein